MPPIMPAGRSWRTAPVSSEVWLKVQYADSDDVIAGDCESVSYSTPTLAAVDTARADAAALAAAIPAIPAF